MSIQAVAWVLEESRAEGFDRLVLLAIANHCDGREWTAYPSVSTIAHEARVSRRTVFRCLLTLRSLGELEVTQSGGGRGQTNLYRIARIPEKRCQEECHADTVSDGNGVKTVTETTVNGDSCGTQNRHEPGTVARTRVREGAGEGGDPSGRPRPSSGEEQPHRPRYHEVFTPGPPVTQEERERSLERIRALREVRS